MGNELDEYEREEGEMDEEDEEAVEKGGVVREEGVAKVIGSVRGGDGGVNAGSTHGLAMLALSSLV